MVGNLACILTADHASRSCERGWHPATVPLVDVIDETYVVAPPDVLAARLADPTVWHRWWPRRELAVFMDRGAEGVRWTVTGDVVGSCEVWLEACGDGTVVHYFLRADPTRRGTRTEIITGRSRRLARRAVRTAREEAVTWKALVNALKDELEAGRKVGENRTEPHKSGIKDRTESAEA